MGLKNDYVNELRKAQKAGDEQGAGYWQSQIDALTKERGDAAFGRAAAKNRKKNAYQVKSGDNWFSIAEQIYGDQRMAGLLMEANAGISVLHQGQVVYLPPMPVVEPGERVFFSQNTFDDALDIEDELKELTSAQDDEVDFTPEELEDLAQTVADAMDAMDEGEFAPASVEDPAAVTGTPIPKTSEPAPTTPETQEGQPLGEEEDFNPQQGQPVASVDGGGFPAGAKDGANEPPRQEFDNPEDALEAWLERELNRHDDPSDQLTKRIQKDYLEMKNLVRTGEITLEDINKLIGEQGQTADNSIFDTLYGTPIPYLDEIGGFPFVTREGWGAEPVVEGINEKFYDENNLDGYQVYDDMSTAYNTIVIHDTGVLLSVYGDQTNEEIALGVQAYHMRNPLGDEIDDQGQGKADIGYHYVIMPDGTIVEGRDIRARGAHVKPENDELNNPVAGNSGSLGIALVGDFDLGDEPTSEQVAALDALVTFLISNLSSIGCMSGHGDINRGNELAEAMFIQSLSNSLGLTYSGTACYKAP